MMELQIFEPKPEQHWTTVKWNNKELKAEIAKSMADYQNLVVTPETKQDNKALRAKLNKLRTAIEAERKSIKARINEPYLIFESQVKEVLEPVNTAISNLDKQLKELEQMEKQKKRDRIEDNFNGLTHPEWLTFEQIFDEKWLNASASINAVLDEVVKRIRDARDKEQTLRSMPDIGVEAAERFKKTLDFNGAVAQAKESWDIQHNTALANPQNGNQKQEAVTETQNMPVEPPKPLVKAMEEEQPKVYTFRFEVQLTVAQAKALGNYCREQGITLTRFL